jgi:hypothetical protein
MKRDEFYLGAIRRKGIGVFCSKPVRRGSRLDLYDGDSVLVAATFASFKFCSKWGVCDTPWNGKYWVPKNAIRMSLCWYLNHCADPNVECVFRKGTWKLTARRDIPADTELTIDYGKLDYSHK